MGTIMSRNLDSIEAIFSSADFNIGDIVRYRNNYGKLSGPVYKVVSEIPPEDLTYQNPNSGKYYKLEFVGDGPMKGTHLIAWENRIESSK